MKCHLLRSSERVGKSTQTVVDAHKQAGAAGPTFRLLDTGQEIAIGVTFLLTFMVSDLASFITGAYIPVCGGNVMPCI